MAPAFLHSPVVKTALILTPVVLPSLWLYGLSRSVASKTTSTVGRRRRRGSAALDQQQQQPPPQPFSVPDKVSDDSEWELAYERITSHPIPASALAFPATGVTEGAGGDDSQPSALLRAYTAAAQRAFTSTPQALAMRSAIREPDARQTFDGEWISNLRFVEGDLVNGAYRVVYHGKGPSADSERVEMAIDPPKGYKGHVPQGLLLSEIQRVKGADDEPCVVFVNETWMWRSVNDPQTLIEAPVSSWFHCLSVGWLIVKGVEAVMAR